MLGWAISFWDKILGLDASQIFALEQATVLEKFLRPVLVYAFLLILIRLYGKRELAQLNPLDLVVLLLLSETVQNAIIGQDNSVTGALLGALALLTTNYLVARVKFRSRRAEKLLEGNPVTLIEKGQLQTAALQRELLTREDLEVIAHREGYQDLESVESCILDPNGSFLVVGKNDADRQREEILQRLEAIQKELATLRQHLVKSP